MVRLNLSIYRFKPFLTTPYSFTPPCCNGNHLWLLLLVAPVSASFPIPWCIDCIQADRSSLISVFLDDFSHLRSNLNSSSDNANLAHQICMCITLYSPRFLSTLLSTRHLLWGMPFLQYWQHGIISSISFPFLTDIPTGSWSVTSSSTHPTLTTIVVVIFCPSAKSMCHPWNPSLEFFFFNSHTLSTRKCYNCASKIWTNSLILGTLSNLSE